MHLRDNLFLLAQEGKLSEMTSLRPLSALWCIGARLKNEIYERKWLPIHQLSIPVVSVGSLTAGGSGKTPLVHLLAKTLQSFGKVAMLSRGYRAKASGLALGDEMQMLKNRIPGGLFYAGKDRRASGKRAINEGAAIALLDDGFQHRKLHRDIELLILDPANPFGYGAFLPRGLLRDPPEQLKRADAVFLNGEADCDLSAYTKAPLIRVRPKIRRCIDWQSKKSVSLKNSRVGAFCAIAHPKRFLETLRHLGVATLESWFLSDHDKPEPGMLRDFAKRCKRRGAEALVCTEKDAVKLELLELPLPIYYLEMELEIDSHGQGAWDSLIEKITLKMNN
jgi:tetraacyldisaccharide 4'-kinase